MTRSMEDSGPFCSLLTDFSKVFDCFPRGLLIGKPDAYVFEIRFLRLVYDYKSNRKRRAKVSNTLWYTTGINPWGARQK